MHTAPCAVSRALEPSALTLEVHDAFLENPVDERACAAQQLGRRLRCDDHC
jgi:hypothetical protein